MSMLTDRSVMGVLVGESILSLPLCYAICIGLHASMLPIGWVSLGIRPGLCAPEKLPTPVKVQHKCHS